MIATHTFMDWQFKAIARKSAHSEIEFNPGDQVVCLIYKDRELDELGRCDVLADEVDSIRLPGPLLGRWVRVMKDPDQESESAQQVMASAEDFFWSLFEVEESDAEGSDSRDALKHLLALMLERKRVVRAVGRRQVHGLQTYVHVKRKVELQVPIVEISIELMQKIEQTLGDIIL
ncbi:hypothetical protein [Coraliomargarita akajimensis]|uniref:Uncharacterized protein n=1 Tax=Coraliomargarita akajimensis (strain DSM 45221 / IAM 15411 / JCM 23193 / KCTC 12865 / 04OKA010-24) TaxID=583355 RepID=D5EHZ6_CORAD|nr:hypothetical protein [Coraliomargarita akajimensis]ADE56036.1 hypothetical protein Caka_3023 [Coraliomargarita akajimensis DSM 45221]